MLPVKCQSIRRNPLDDLRVPAFRALTCKARHRFDALFGDNNLAGSPALLFDVDSREWLETDKVDRNIDFSSYHPMLEDAGLD